MRFEFVSVPEWPVLAWLAQCRNTDPVVTVFHGAQVEVADEWFSEAAWAGDFDQADFDQTDVVSGSGGRRRGREMVFVSAGSTVDRLQSLETPEGAWVSNSLACLLSATGAEIDETAGDYFAFFHSIIEGTAKYRRLLATSAGPVRLTYFDNLVWDGRTLAVRPKPAERRDFSTFARYFEFLDSSMQALALNAAAAGRRYPYQILSTASSGYDSSAVTVLAHRAGARQVLCFDQARRGVDDSGEPLARTLGLEPVVVPRSAWSEAPMPETAFLAADSHGGDVFFKGAEPILRGKVLLTGYHGDKMWGLDTHSLDEHIVRGDQSGLSLTEYRLTIGLLHAPVPFWGVRQIADVDRLNRSPELAPWHVEGDYSRPICRRIVESAGVPRDMFGNQKKATWVLLLRNRNFLSPQSAEDYLRWLHERRGRWLRRGRVPPLRSRRLDALDIALRDKASRIAGENVGRVKMLTLRATGIASIAWRLSEAPPYLRRFLFPWALHHHRRAYSRVV